MLRHCLLGEYLDSVVLGVAFSISAVTALEGPPTEQFISAVFSCILGLHLTCPRCSMCVNKRLGWRLIVLFTRLDFIRFFTRLHLSISIYLAFSWVSWGVDIGRLWGSRSVELVELYGCSTHDCKSAFMGLCYLTPYCEIGDKCHKRSGTWSWRYEYSSKGGKIHYFL